MLVKKARVAPSCIAISGFQPTQFPIFELVDLPISQDLQAEDGRAVLAGGNYGSRRIDLNYDSEQKGTVQGFDPCFQYGPLKIMGGPPIFCEKDEKKACS